MGYSLPKVLLEYIDTFPKRGVENKSGITNTGEEENMGDTQDGFFGRLWNAQILKFDFDGSSKYTENVEASDDDESEQPKRRGRPPGSTNKSPRRKADERSGSAQETSGEATREQEQTEVPEPKPEPSIAATVGTATAPEGGASATA